MKTFNLCAQGGILTPISSGMLNSRAQGLESLHANGLFSFQNLKLITTGNKAC